MASANPVNFARTSFAATADEPLGVWLEIAGVRYEVAQFAASFAVNEVPEAMCMLATGRRVPRGRAGGRQFAKIHDTAASLKAMKKVKVFMRISGEFSPGGPKWPAKEQEVFSGYLSGISYQKVRGKVTVVANLLHWLIDLSFTSCLSSVSHPANPADLTSRAIMAPLPVDSGAAGGLGRFLPENIPQEAIAPLLTTDLWAALKTLFCGMSRFPGFNPVCGPLAAAGLGEAQLAALQANNRATKALKRIEGPAGDCGLAYKYGRAVPLNAGAAAASQGIARAIGNMYLAPLWNHTLWDVMIGQFCPQFGLDLCPGMDRAVVTASLPGYRAPKPWRSIAPSEYDFLDQTAQLSKPLRAVVAHGTIAMDTGASETAAVNSGTSCLSGIFASTAEEDGDGAILYRQVPDWVAESVHGGEADPTGLASGDPVVTATTPGAAASPPVGPTPSQLMDDGRKLLDRYARAVFVQNALRGRSGSLSGKLRFDVAPGSHVKIASDPERFAGAEDSLACDLFAQVNRVTIEINAEGRRASTGLFLTDLRTAAENAADRTSAAEHPFYANAIMPGMPLLEALELTP